MVNLYLSVALLLSQLTPLGLALRLLLIGDSVDRCIVQDWCGLQRSRGVQVTSFNWGDSSIKYASKKGMMPSDICVSTTDSIAFVHIFGSNATGPYLHMFSNSPEDPYVDTQVRVKKSIELYKAHVGLPDRIPSFRQTSGTCRGATTSIGCRKCTRSCGTRLSSHLSAAWRLGSTRFWKWRV